MDPSRCERGLAIILRVSGTVTLLALVAVLMPRGWMAATHLWLRLGTFPEGPIVEYLARSLSAFYAIHGALFWFLASDIRRYAPVIAFLGWTGLLGGVGLLVLDWHLDLPLPWLVCEGPFVVLLCAVILVLARRSAAAAEAEASKGTHA
jgi:hypothetical protein